MSTRTIGIVIDGATGRLGPTQHLRSLMGIRSEAGCRDALDGIMGRAIDRAGLIRENFAQGGESDAESSCTDAAQPSYQSRFV